jgi:cell division protein FtsX
MLEGVFAALMGAVAAGAVILLANTLLFSRIGETLTFLGPVFSFTSTEIVTVMLVLGGTGCAVGLVGSMMALRRFLEV